MASTTTTFLKSRAAASAAIKPGQWHAGFSKMKKYAEDNKIPLIAVWSNGDKCGHCINFEKSVMQSVFTTWMKSSGCAFWFGCSSDTSTDDKYEGTGFNWTRNKKLNLYPFVRVYWKAGKVDQCKTGDDWTGGKSTGGSTFVKKLKELLKNFKPQTEPAPTPTPTPEPEPTEPDCTGDDCKPECSGDDCNADCTGDNCNANESCCSDVKAVLESANAELEENGMTKKFGQEVLKAISLLQSCECSK